MMKENIFLNYEINSKGKIKLNLTSEKLVKTKCNAFRVTHLHFLKLFLY